MPKPETEHPTNSTPIGGNQDTKERNIPTTTSLKPTDNQELVNLEKNQTNSTEKPSTPKLESPILSSTTYATTKYATSETLGQNATSSK